MRDAKVSLFQRPLIFFATALLCTSLWGSASPVIKLSYEMFQIEAADLFSKCLLAGVRFTIAGVLILVLAFIRYGSAAIPKGKDLPGLMGLGVVQTTIQYLFFYIGLTYTTGAKGALFSSVDCFFVVLLAPLIVKGERYSAQKLLGCVLGCVGLVLASIGTDLTQLVGFTLRGEGLVMLSSLCFAMSFFYVKKLMKQHSPEMVTGWQMVFGGVLLILAGVLGGGKMSPVSMGSAVMLMAYLCLLSSVAYTLWSVLMKYNPVHRVSILKLFTPIFGAWFSAILLGENPFELIKLIALAFVCAGIWTVNHEKHPA